MSLCASGDQKLDAAVNGWLKIDKNPKTREEVVQDIACQRWDKLRNTMMHRHKFGTAGMRGPMSAGYLGMNDVVVLQTAQGLCSFIKKECSQSQIKNGIVVGFDGRYNSKRFAELTAKVFISSSIPVHIFSDVCPTPLVSFATILYGCAGGVMVTASHNPKQDNGYKVYWGNGSQIIKPHDEQICDEILACLEIPDDHWNIDEVRSHDLVKHCQEEVTAKYMEYVRECLSPEVLADNKKCGVQTVYSGMHGVGYEYVMEAFEVAGLKRPISVTEQEKPDPEFPTVRFPNPEERECMERALKRGEGQARLALVNDPDADRLAVAEFQDNTKTWKIFSGNEMGALLGWWLVRDGGDPEEAYVIASVVSSKMLRAIAKGKAHFVETLTGFKWMGNTTLLLQQEGKRALFAFEEAIGYMCSPRVPDKDGVTAAVQVASLASYLYLRGSSLFEKLQDLYKEFGYYVCFNSYFPCNDPDVIRKIFRRIRNYDGPGLYPSLVGGIEIVSVHDLTAGVKVPEAGTGDGHLKVLGTGLDQEYSGGEMVMFSCGGGLAVTVRTSGTEPKLKYYAELCGPANTLREQEDMETKLKHMVCEFLEELLQPKAYGLINKM